MKRVLWIVSLLLVAAPLLASAWAFGGLRADLLARVMPWASLACAVGIFLLPQRHSDEGGWLAAERRVLGGLVRDPFFWTALAFFVYLLVPLFNVSLCPICDWRQIDAGVNPFPRFRFLPFCSHAGEHAGVLWWFGPALLTALGVRHGLLRAGRRALVELLVWNATALALLGFVQLATGAAFPFWTKPERPMPFFSVFGYVNTAGAFFAFAYALSLGLWFDCMGRVENAQQDLPQASPRHLHVRTHYPLLAVSLNLCAVLATLCRAAIVLSAMLTGIFFVYLVLRAFSGADWRRALRFRSAVAAALLMFGLFGAIFVYAPPEVGREIRSLSPLALADRVSGKGQYHTRVASAVMRDFPFFGVGGWGYRHFGPVYMTEKERRGMQRSGGANVHNDYLQFLAEHGLVGFGLLVACAWLLLRQTVQIWRQLLVAEMAAERSRMSPSSSLIFVVQPLVVWSFLGCVAVLVHAFGDCPFRSGSVMTMFFGVLAAMTGFLPRKVQPRD